MASLGVNIDHIANIREARRTVEPDPVSMALLAELGGADGITVHLREDRRHIQDRDVELLRQTVRSRLNLEMAATEEMVAIALRIKPDMVTLVPERREEVTTEGGLDVAGQEASLGAMVQTLQAAGIPVSLFVDPEATQLQACKATRACFCSSNCWRQRLAKRCRPSRLSVRRSAGTARSNSRVVTCCCCFSKPLSVLSRRGPALPLSALMSTPNSSTTRRPAQLRSSC